MRLEHGLDPEAGAELGVKELDAHPGQALLGFSAPIAWTAIGVSAEGWPCEENGRAVSEAPAEGLIVDCLRRALGRRTSPPAASTATLFATCWLENVVAQARDTGRQVGWTATVVLHPAAPVLARSGQVVKPGDLVEAATTFARLCVWTMVRHQVIAGWRPLVIDL